MLINQIYEREGNYTQSSTKLNSYLYAIYMLDFVANISESLIS